MRLQEDLVDKNAPFGIDLLLPQVGGSARKTNKDCAFLNCTSHLTKQLIVASTDTGGKLNELIDIIIAEKAALFVCAVGVPPKEVVERLHAAGIPVMNMVGAVKHCEKALAVGVDIICAQGSFSFHTFVPLLTLRSLHQVEKEEDTPETSLLPFSSPLASNSLPAESLPSPASRFRSSLLEVSTTVDPSPWLSLSVLPPSVRRFVAFRANSWLMCDFSGVGTRFICAEEAGAPRAHQQAVLTAGHNDTIRSLSQSRSLSANFAMNF